MEKFAVDLDRVLDEFEYNEDCAELMARCGRRKYDFLSSEEINQYSQAETSKSSSEERNVESREHLPEYHCHVNAESFLGSKLDGILHYDVRQKDLNECDSKDCSTKFLTMNTSNIKLGETKPSLNCKLNVSGVFSCLNEYINTRSVSLHLSQTDCHFCEEDTSNETVNTRSNTYHNTVVSDKLGYCESGSDKSHDKEQTPYIATFQDPSNHKPASPSVDHQETLSNQHDEISPKSPNEQSRYRDTGILPSPWKECDSSLRTQNWGEIEEHPSGEEQNSEASSELREHRMNTSETKIEDGGNENCAVKSGKELNGLVMQVTEKKVPHNVNKVPLSTAPAVFEDHEEYSEEFLNAYLNNLEMNDGFSSLEEYMKTVTADINKNEVNDCENSGYHSNGSIFPAGASHPSGCTVLTLQPCAVITTSTVSETAITPPITTATATSISKVSPANTLSPSVINAAISHDGSITSITPIIPVSTSVTTDITTAAIAVTPITTTATTIGASDADLAFRNANISVTLPPPPPSPPPNNNNNITYIAAAVSSLSTNDITIPSITSAMSPSSPNTTISAAGCAFTTTTTTATTSTSIATTTAAGTTMVSNVTLTTTVTTTSSATTTTTTSTTTTAISSTTDSTVAAAAAAAAATAAAAVASAATITTAAACITTSTVDITDSVATAVTDSTVISTHMGNCTITTADDNNTSCVTTATCSPSFPTSVSNLNVHVSNDIPESSSICANINPDNARALGPVSVSSTFSISTQLSTFATDTSNSTVQASPVNFITTSSTPLIESTTCLASTLNSAGHAATDSTTTGEILPEHSQSLNGALPRDCSSETITEQTYGLMKHEDELLSSESSPKVNTVTSIECQEINRNIEIQPQNSSAMNMVNSGENSCHQASTIKDMKNYDVDGIEDRKLAADVAKESSEMLTNQERKDQSVKTECTQERNSISHSSADPDTPRRESQLRLELNMDSPMEKVDTGIYKSDSVVESASAFATGEDLVLSSPDTSETSSVEVAVHQMMSTEAENLNNEVGLVSEEQNKLGRIPPFWVPDDQAPSCMLCCCKFTVLKRRHHCRACGKVFCSKCCCMKYRLDYLNSAEVRVCLLCHDALVRDRERSSLKDLTDASSADSSRKNSDVSRQPNPNNPMEYCSTIPPLEQAASALSQPVPSVLVPVGVLKREGCSRLKSDVAKQVMFSDGIRPGGDLTEIDGSSEQRILRQSDTVIKRVSNLSGMAYTSVRLSRSVDIKTKSFMAKDGLPPLAVVDKGNLNLEDIPLRDMTRFLTSLRCETNPPAVFALNQNLFVKVKILNLDCCVNRVCWCFSTEGMSCVSQDEIVIILECSPKDNKIPKDIFHFLNTLYHEASKGSLVAEMGHTVFKNSTFLGSSDHGGFLYIRPSFQCLHKIIVPTAPYLVGILIHRWEIPWAKLFPIRLMLRLGAEFRYYPCMLVSVQQREPVYCEIGHTIMNLLADFRNMSYTLPSVPGMVIHMEDRHTSILLPKNRYDQVSRALNNSNDHVLALAANFSLDADSHLVCMQSPTDDSYHTQAINIHNKPRKVTGASFVVFNGALKISSNLMAKSTIVEDGLMVQITPDMIQELRSSLHKMKDFVVRCGPTTASVPDEVVDVRWVEEDRNFNIGVRSVIDGLALDGVPSIRVHNGSDFMGKTRFIRWTEVFILQSGSIADGMLGSNDTVDVSHIAENLAAATCMALCDFLDLLAQSGFTRIAVRANIHQDDVEYAVGSQGERLPPIYMKTLDSTLVPVLHHTATVISNSSPVVLELLFHIMLQ